MRITHQQIADKLGVSRTLVTGVLHGTGRFAVSDRTREKIEATAREMGYQPRNVTTHTVGYVMLTGQMQSRVEVEFLVDVERALREKGYRLTLISPDLPEGQSLGDVINQKNMDGVLLTYWDEEYFRPIISPRLPFLLLSEQETDPGIEQVCVDLKGTSKSALEYLYQHGHRRVALFMGARQKGFYRRLGNAAEQAAKEYLPDLRLDVYDNRPTESGVRAMELMNSAEPPTAVMVCDSEHAIAVYCNLLKAGYDIPGDVSVVSLFDARDFHVFEPPLTAADAGGSHMAQLAVKRLLEKIDMPETIPQHCYVPGGIIERGSVAIARTHGKK